MLPYSTTLFRDRVSLNTMSPPKSTLYSWSVSVPTFGCRWSEKLTSDPFAFERQKPILQWRRVNKDDRLWCVIRRPVNARFVCSVRRATFGEEKRPDRRRHGLDFRRMALAGAGAGSHLAGTVHQKQVRRRVNHSTTRHHGCPLSTRVRS